MIALGCSDIASALSGSCYGSQTLAGTTVNVCSESPTLTIDQQATLNTACRSGQLGSVASNWQQGAACQSAGRVGGCRRTFQGIDLVSWVYSAPNVNATVVRAFCAQIGATYQSP
jgi:hypothetical protein